LSQDLSNQELQSHSEPQSNPQLQLPTSDEGQPKGRNGGGPSAIVTWDPEQYLRYADERQRPFWDLVGQIRTETTRNVVDLGCGPGTATAGLRRRWPEAEILGIDNSEVMISRALDALADELASPTPLVDSDETHARPALTFLNEDITTWKPAPASLDVILSNSALHWVPRHMDLFATWLAALRPGGTLAFQVPGNFNAPSHTLLAELATSPGWRPKLAAVPSIVEAHEPADYYRALNGLASTVDIWETTYYHCLEGDDPVLEWVRGSALRPYLERLGAADAIAFTVAYRRALRLAYPAEESGKTLFAFRRIFVVAST